MSQETLNNTMLLTYHKAHTDKLDLVSVAQTFIDINDIRRKYFDTFEL